MNNRTSRKRTFDQVQNAQVFPPTKKSKTSTVNHADLAPSTQSKITQYLQPATRPPISLSPVNEHARSGSGTSVIQQHSNQNLVATVDPIPDDVTPVASSETDLDLQDEQKRVIDDCPDNQSTVIRYDQNHNHSHQRLQYHSIPINTNTDINNYQCEQCQLLVHVTQPPLSCPQIKRYLVQYICDECTTKGRQRKRGQDRICTAFKCDESDCIKYGHVWDGYHALRSWSQHYATSHPTDEYLRIVQKKLCDHEDCVDVVALDVAYCVDHAVCVEDDDDLAYAEQKQSSYFVCDRDDNHIPIRDLLFHVDVHEDYANDDQKDEAAKLFVRSILRIANHRNNPNKAIAAAVDLMLFGATYHHKPHRNDNHDCKRERQRRIQLLKARKYKVLVDRIRHAQQKRDAKRHRQREKRLANEPHDAPPIPTDSPSNAALHIDTSHIQQENAEICNYNKLADMMHDLKYSPNETDSDVKRRISRAVHYAKRGSWRRANRALEGDKIADMHVHDNWTKTKRKFPTGGHLDIAELNIPAPTFRITRDRVKQIIEDLTSDSAAGPGGIANDLLIWMVQRDDIYHVSRAIHRICKESVCHGLPDLVRELLLYARGIPLGKEKNGQFDHDIRPIILLSSLIRLMDTVNTKNVPKDALRAAIGPYQTVGVPRSCEIANVAVQQAVEMLSDMDEMALLSVDAVNAFNSVDRAVAFEIIQEVLPDLVHWFIFLYGRGLTIDFMDGHYINMLNGAIQGLTSSGVIYSAVKWRIDQMVLADMQTVYDDFKLDFQTDFFDDGIKAMHYQCVPEYAAHLVQRCRQHGISVNADKSAVIMMTDQKHIIDYIQTHCANWKRTNFSGCFTYLGVTYGDDDYRSTSRIKKTNTMIRKLKHIDTINNRQIKLTLLRKFMGVNKVLYALKNTPYDPVFVAAFDDIYNYITETICMHLNWRDVMEYQLPMGGRYGGLGLRRPDIIQNAARLTLLTMSEDDIHCYFNLGAPDIDDDLKEDSAFLLQRAYQRATQRRKAEADDTINRINTFLRPDFTFNLLVYSQYRYRDLIALIDKKYLNLFYSKATVQDCARIRSLSVSGAMSWLDVPANSHYGVEFSNVEHFISLAQILGTTLISEEQKCRRCGQRADIYGHHSLHCSHGGHLIMRHNCIRDEIRKYMHQAGFNTEVEVKYYDIDQQVRPLVGSDSVVINGIPGDIKVYNWFPRRYEASDSFMDIVVGNIYAPSYVARAAKQRLYLAEEKDKLKKRKYHYAADLIPLALETTGAMGIGLRRVLQVVADRIATRKSIPYSIIIRRIRQNISAHLMQQNAQMVLTSIQL